MEIRKRAIVGFELFLMIISIFAFSYIIYDSNGLIEEFDKEYNKIEDHGEDVLLVLGKLFLNKIRKPVFNVVSAAAPGDGLGLSCCKFTKSDGVCQNVFNLNECQEDSSIEPNSECKETSFCRYGCCIDDEVGTYDINTPQILCGVSDPNVRWIGDANCNIDEAKPGCCNINIRKI